MRVSEVFNTFIYEKQVQGIYESTINTYYNIVGHIFIEKFIEDKEIGELKLEDIQKFIIKTRNTVESVNTVKTYWRHVKAFLRWAYINDYMENDLTLKIPPLRGYRTMKDIYQDDEIMLIYASIKGKSLTAWQKRAIFAILLDTGIRMGELIHLRVSDINKQQRYINIRGMKGHSDRRVPISAAAMRHIDNYLIKREIPYNSPDEDILFMNKEHAPITQYTLSSYIHTNVKKQGIERGNVHLFRHTFITRKCLETNDVFTVQNIAGHKDLATTRRYYQAASSYQVANVSMMPIPMLLAQVPIIR